MIGQILAGRYRVLQVLGAGGFGQTYIAADLHLPGQPQCVLKHLKPATIQPEVLTLARQLFHKEAETLQQLGNHDRIPRLLAFFEEDQEFYLVQDFIRGHTLAYELTSGQPWSESAVERLLQEVLEILQFVHGQGVIHRDIKPENLMRRDEDGRLMLIDFGAIKQVRGQNITQMGQTVAIGTPGYMAPEQARGTPRPSSDIYALGVIGIQALTGRYPTDFAEDDRTGELQWQSFTNASPHLVQVLTRMTRYHFRDRYSDAHSALVDLPQPLGSGGLAGGNTASWPAPTAATQVVSPAAAYGPATVEVGPPARQDRHPWKLPKGLVWLGILGTSGLVGYGLASRWGQIVGHSSFDRRLPGQLCRTADPTKGSTTKVRDQPDRQASPIAILNPGDKVIEVSRQEPFVQIEQRNGQRGWVFNDQIAACDGTNIKPSAAKPSPKVSSPKPQPISTQPTPDAAEVEASPSESPDEPAAESESPEEPSTSPPADAKPSSTEPAESTESESPPPSESPSTIPEATPTPDGKEGEGDGGNN